MSKKEKTPDMVFSVSWEVCNRIGGIYTVLSMQAKALSERLNDKLIYIGPDFGVEENELFSEDKELYKEWIANCRKKTRISVKAGRWNIPGKPCVLLIDHKNVEDELNDFLFDMWKSYKVDSLNAYGDYNESVLFGYASAKVIENFQTYHKLTKKSVMAHFHEWTTGSGLLYLKMNVPSIKTLFTTHATTTGRSICFNQKALYQYFANYNGDQMAAELNVTAKHLVEKHAAHEADCFTTVSDLTATECKQLLEKQPDIVTPNGYEDDFVPSGTKYTKARKEARAILKNVAENLLGYQLDDDALFIGTSGRYEYRNKGIDLFLESLKLATNETENNKEIVAFILVPGWNIGARKDLQQKLADPNANYNLCRRFITHDIHNFDSDLIVNAIRSFRFNNEKSDKVKVILVPSYLHGNDGIFNKCYYDLLIGLDLTIFASYYEPWGYTPLESAAFGIPTITTNLAGFGLWCSTEQVDISNGVAVIHRNDTNYFEAADSIKDNIIQFASMKKKEVQECSKKALNLAKDCSWDTFISYYMDAFQIASKKKN